MADKKKTIDKLLESLHERSKELNCLFEVEEILSEYDAPLEDVCPRIISAIPPGMQYSDVCVAKIVIENRKWTSDNFTETAWRYRADIVIQELVIGTAEVYYTESRPQADHGPFLDEEAKLIRMIAERMGHFIMHKKMRKIVQQLDSSRPIVSRRRDGCEWKTIMDLLQKTDHELYMSISRKMLNHLCWSGIGDAEELMQSFGSEQTAVEEELDEHWNQPHQRRALGLSADFSAAVFKIADNNFPDEQILALIQKWIQEDKLSFLVQVVNRNLSLAEVADAIRRYHHLMQEEKQLPSPGKKGVLVSLIRRFLSDQLSYVNIAKNYIKVEDFYHLLQKVIFSTESHGKLGGKSAGLYLAAQILKKAAADHKILSSVKVPKTWHITSDVLLHFMHYNNFDEVVEQKYKEINQVRLEYPHIVQTFKSALFPTDIIKGLSVALDDFEDGPLIVRSSSLLEDRMGAAFSGKYKSLFLANQGSKQKRLDALMDAIAEVYASTFSPDPIEYRAERGLIDFGEEMGIMIQEVVGTRIGKYFLPSYAGVAFSHNEFRWSPRIRRTDGLVRLVPGLGTRAVDRLSSDYPVLIAPGQPGLQVNVSPDEVVRYSPKEIDVINLETNNFETKEISEFLKEVGYEVPGITDMISIFRDNHLSRPMGMNVDFDTDDLIVTFDGLISKTPFVRQMKTMLDLLENTIGLPVDVEFASDGRDFYLLQCRPQSYAPESMPAPIPKNLPADQIVFTANRHVSNGRVPDITHVVYVDPGKYSELANRADLIAVGRAVSQLNKLLPKRQFILMGPGRWGSRGDIKLGVNVTYSDINNTAILVEIARKKGNYVPDLSFGTHFFQDLVESNIRYLPLYPDDDGVLFNEKFFEQSRNILPEVLPEYAPLADTVRLIDVQGATGGKVLRILMNADLERAVGLLVKPFSDVGGPAITFDATAERRPVEDRAFDKPDAAVKSPESHWKWRLQMAERMAADLVPERFGVVAFYVFGSTKNSTAGPKSNIDVLIHFHGTDEQLERLNLWLEGWNLALSEINFIQTGYRVEKLLNVHIVSDEDVKRKSGFAAKIGAATDPARPLPMNRRPRDK